MFGFFFLSKHVLNQCYSLPLLCFSCPSMARVLSGAQLPQLIWLEVLRPKLTIKREKTENADCWRAHGVVLCFFLYAFSFAMSSPILCHTFYRLMGLSSKPLVCVPFSPFSAVDHQHFSTSFHSHFSHPSTAVIFYCFVVFLINGLPLPKSHYLILDITVCRLFLAVK